MFQNQRPFLKIWIFSLLFHTLVLASFYLIHEEDTEKIKMHLTKGSVLSLWNRVDFRQSGYGKPQNSQLSSDSIEGTSVMDREIDQFRNSLSYPELAIEQGLEDDCTFRVTVAENGLAEKLVVVAPCKYNVFDSQIRSQLRTWKFNVSKGKDLILPIRFRIHARE